MAIDLEVSNTGTDHQQILPGIYCGTSLRKSYSSSIFYISNLFIYLKEEITATEAQTRRATSACAVRNGNYKPPLLVVLKNYG